MQTPINRSPNEPIEARLQHRISGEAFLRRAALLDSPDFMLKGSYVGRNYFADPEMRQPNDLDWVFLTPCKDPETARQRFSEWVDAVTARELDDGVVFARFHDAAYWHMFDYAMAEDFPTVNTWLRGLCDRIPVKLNLDISFNLDLPLAPVAQNYVPIRGEAFWMPKTAPLPLQIAWKLHQCIVRPRLKDVFDLRHMLYHPSFDADSREQCLSALGRECEIGKISSNRLDAFFSEPWSGLLNENAWQRWRAPQHNFGFENSAASITNADALPEKLTEFLDEYRQALIHAGLIAADTMPVNLPNADMSPKVAMPIGPSNPVPVAKSLPVRGSKHFWQKLSDWFF